MTSAKDLSQRPGRAMLIAALVLAMAPIARAQNVQRDGPQEGIKIHGHWVMQVLNADGTPVERREFDNALTANGAASLSRLLTRTNGLGRWTIELFSFSGGPCAGGTFNGSPINQCFIVDAEATPRPTGTAVFATLTSGIGGPNSNQVILSGNATAPIAGRIDRVATVQTLCSNTVVGCNLPGDAFEFTAHDLVNSQGALIPVQVTAGQIVQVTVTISFCNSTECL